MFHFLTNPKHELDAVNNSRYLNDINFVFFFYNKTNKSTRIRQKV